MELALGLGLLVLVFLTGGDKKKNGTPEGGSLGPVPGWDPSAVPGRPHKGPDGEGDAWVQPDQRDALPGVTDFDWSGNGFYIDPNCRFVLEGDQFWPDAAAFSVMAIEKPTLGQTLAIEGNSVLGFVDYLINEEGEDDPLEIVWRVVEEASPMCAAVEPEQWSAPMQAWFNDFLDRVTDHAEEAGIDFG